MSIKIMTAVWDRYPGSGSELLTMLALADWCADDGGSLYPSMKSVAHKIRTSEKQARRIVHGLVDAGFLTVVGNEHGGAPGTTKQFRMNVQRIMCLPVLRDVQATETAPTHVTPPTGVTPPTHVRDGSHPCPETAPTHVPGRLPPVGAKPSLEPSIEPSMNHHIPTAPSAPVAVRVVEVADEVVDAVGALVPSAPASRSVKTRSAATDTPLQSACRATWAAYSEAYLGRHGVAPIRNARVNSAVKSIVQRLGFEEAPAVAAFFVACVNDAFVVRQMHDVGLLLKGAEGYRTQWATGRAVTATRARQADESAANFSAADEAKAILRQRRAARAAQGGAHAE